MDLDRGIVKALFYDYPIDALVAQLDKSNNSKSSRLQQDVFLDILPQLMQWSKQEYTYTEANLLRIQTGGDWTEGTNSLPTVYHPFDIIQKIAEKLLTTVDDQPVVRFEQLFRWKDTALYVGEDILSTAYIAAHDLKINNAKRNLFIWDDILPHDNQALNAVLNKGLADVHAHYYATGDVFNLNWISLTNNLKQRENLDKIKRPQEIEILSSQTEYPSTLKQQCVAAAYLRFVFYRMLIKPCSSQDTAFIEDNYQKEVYRILRDSWYADAFALKLQATITYALQSSMQTVEHQHVDYCLLQTKEICDLLSGHKREKVNLIYQGERQLVYRFFYGYYGKDKQCIGAAPYFYLYLLLKNKIRREFVQINRIKGFENFETYQDRKDLFIPAWSPVNKHFGYYVLNSSAHSPQHDLIEPRVTPKNIVKESYGFGNPLFAVPNPANYETIKGNKKNKFDIVVHFIKNGKYEASFPTPFNKVGYIKDCTRDEKYRDQIKKLALEVIRFKDNKSIVGIDAASREIFCRPEVFSHVYRYADMKGITNKTYHAGEDFLDLPGGLRAIDEAILFLDLNENCRIGHAMALGINVKDYYERRHYTSVTTQQYLLDDCVWLYMRAKELNAGMSDAFANYLEKKAAYLYEEIGYKKTWNIHYYWLSMLLRGNDPQYLYQPDSNSLSIWEKTANSENEEIKAVMKHQDAKDLFYDYFYDKGIKKKGIKLIQQKWDSEIVTIIENLQNKMQQQISKMKIAIECCPTSNLKIGYIERYDEHPLLTKFYPIDKVNSDPSYPLIKSSINTDDRGVFHTSIYEEYSLIALALEKSVDDNNKRKYNEPTVLRYIEEIRENAHQMAFKRINEK